MPARPFRPCAHIGCGALVRPPALYCPQHERQAHEEQRCYDRQRGNAAARGYDGNWQRVRARVLREQPYCEDCLRQGVATLATEVHHLNGNVRNLLRGNLRSLCKSCHSRRTVLQQGWRATKRRGG